MMHVIDGSEGALDSGRYPEPTRLLLQVGEGDVVRVVAPFEPWLGMRADERGARRVPALPAGIPIGLSVRRSETDRVHAWSRTSARWALRAERGIDLDLTILESPARVSRRVRRVAERLSAFGRIRVHDAADADAWMRAGVPEGRLHVEPPQAACVHENVRKWADRVGLPGDRASLRGLLHADDDEFVVFPIASPWAGFDAHRFVFLLGMLRINGTPATAIVPAAAWRLVGARVFREQSRLGTRVCVIDGPMSPWLAASDAAFVDAQRPREALLSYRPRGALRVLVAAAEAAGVPVAVAPGSLLEVEPRRAPSVANELRPLLTIAERWNSSRAAVHARSPALVSERVHCGA